MRHVGTLPPGRPAEGLLAVLAARGVDAVLREGGLWVLDGDALPEAASQLQRFSCHPEALAWRRAIAEALSRSEDESRAASEQIAARARRVSRRERRLRRAFQGAASSRPLTLALLVTFSGLALPGSHDATVLLPVLASLYWLHELGTQVEAMRGSRSFALLVLSLTVASQALLHAAGFGFAGLFGVGFGLLGFTAARARQGADSGLGVPRGLLSLMGLWLLVCAAGAAPPAILLAQCSGLVAGLLIGTVPRSLVRL